MDNDSNLPVPIDGQNSANIGTDVYPISGGTAHAQVVKVAWGNSLNVNRADEDTPLPVKIFGLTGSLATVTVTGSVGGLGKFTVTNTVSDPLQVTGGVRAFVSGTTGGTPVAVTGGVYILGNVGITGAVNVTGGRFLSHTTDTVQVTGSVARGWVLNNADDNVKIWSHSGGTLIPSAIYSSSGVGIGASGNALNVNVIGAAINATVTVGATVGIDNAVGTVLRVQGTANGTPIPVSVNGVPSVYLRDDATLISTNNPLYVDSTPTQLIIGSIPTSMASANNIEKMFVANNPRTANQAGTLHTAAQWLSFLWDSVGEKGSTEAETIQTKLTTLINTFSGGSATVKNKLDINPTGPKIKKYSLSAYVSPLVSDSTKTSYLPNASNGYMYINQSTTDSILLTSDEFLIDVLGPQCYYALTNCPSGVSKDAEGVVILSTAAAQLLVENGGYILGPDNEIFLPIKFTRFFLINTNLSTTGTLTVVVS